MQLDSAALSTDIALQRALGGGYESPRNSQVPLPPQRTMNANHRTGSGNPRTASGAGFCCSSRRYSSASAALWAAYWILVLSSERKPMMLREWESCGDFLAGIRHRHCRVGDDTQLVNAAQVLVKARSTDAQTALSRAASALAQTVRQVRQQKATAGQYDSE